MNLNPHRDLFHLQVPPGCTWPAYMEVHLLRPFVISDLAFDPRPIRPTKNRSKPLECRVYPPRTAQPRNFLIAASAHSGLSSCTTGWWCIALPPQCITDWLSEAPCISVNRRHNLVQSLAFLHKSTSTLPPPVTLVWSPFIKGHDFVHLLRISTCNNHPQMTAMTFYGGCLL